MKVTKRTCDLCHNEAKGKLAKVTAPKKWAKGDYAEDEPKAAVDAESGISIRMMSIFMASSEAEHCELDVCRHCFKALFGAAVWLRDLVQKEMAR